MNGLQTPIKFEDYEQLAWRLAHRFYKAVAAKGKVSIEVEDLFQEAALSFLDAVAKFDPDRGFQFSTYYYRAVTNRLARYVNLPEVQTVSMDEERDASSISLHDFLVSTEPDQEANIIRQDYRDKLMDELSHRTRRILEMVESPPACINKEMEALRAKAQYARDNGVMRQAKSSVSVTLIMQIMGLDSDEKAAVRREIRNVVQRAAT